MTGRLAFVLDAQEHHDLGVRQRPAQVVRDADAHRGEPVRHERGRADEGHGGAHLGEGVDIRARHPAEKNVAEDHHLAAAQRAEVFLHREGVEQALGRVLVGAVPRVDHWNVENPRKVERRAGGGVADHDHVGLQRLDVFGRVAQGFALRGAAAGGVEGDNVGAQPLGGHVEGHPRPRAGLEEEIDDRLAAQGGYFFHAARQRALERGRGGVDLLDLGEREFLEGDQVSAVPGHREGREWR